MHLFYLLTFVVDFGCIVSLKTGCKHFWLVVNGTVVTSKDGNYSQKLKSQHKLDVNCQLDKNGNSYDRFVLPLMLHGLVCFATDDS